MSNYSNKSNNNYYINNSNINYSNNKSNNYSNKSIIIVIWRSWRKRARRDLCK